MQTHQINLIKPKPPDAPFVAHLRPRRPIHTNLPAVLEPILHFPVQHQLRRVRPVRKHLVHGMLPARDHLPHALAHRKDVVFALDLLNADLERRVGREGVGVRLVRGRRVGDFVELLEEGHNAGVDGEVGWVRGFVGVRHA